MVGDEANIENIADRLAVTLEAYNSNFKKITRHNVLVDKNLNSLAKLGENLTNYEKFTHQNNFISSVLAAGNSKRLQKSLEIFTNLQRLKDIIENSEHQDLLQQLSNALLEIHQPCVIKNQKCVVYSYISQGHLQSEIILHLVTKHLKKSEDFIVSCLPSYENDTWRIPAMHQEHYYLNGTTLFNENMTFPTHALTNEKWLSTHLSAVD